MTTKPTNQPMSRREHREKHRRRMKERVLIVLWLATMITLGVFGFTMLCQPSAVLDRATLFDVGSWWAVLYGSLAGRMTASTALTATGLMCAATLTLNHALSRYATERRRDDVDSTSDEDFHSSAYWRDNSDKVATGFATAAVLLAMSAWLDPNVRGSSGTAIAAAGVAGFAVWLAASVAEANASAADRAARKDDRAVALTHVRARRDQLPASSRADTRARQYWSSAGWISRALGLLWVYLLITAAAASAAALIGWGMYCLIGWQLYPTGVLFYLSIVAVTICGPTVYIAMCASHFRWLNVDTEEKGDKWNVVSRRLRMVYIATAILTGVISIDPRGTSIAVALTAAVFFGLAVLVGPATVWWLTFVTAADRGPAPLRSLMSPLWVTIARSLNRRERELVRQTFAERDQPEEGGGLRVA